MRKSNINNNPVPPSLGSSVVETEENSNLIKDASRIDENANFKFHTQISLSSDQNGKFFKQQNE